MSLEDRLDKRQLLNTTSSRAYRVSIYSVSMYDPRDKQDEPDEDREYVPNDSPYEGDGKGQWPWDRDQPPHSD